MDVESIKRFIKENQKGLIVGFAAGFIVRVLLGR